MKKIENFTNIQKEKTKKKQKLNSCLGSIGLLIHFINSKKKISIQKQNKKKII